MTSQNTQYDFDLGEVQVFPDFSIPIWIIAMLHLICRFPESQFCGFKKTN